MLQHASERLLITGDSAGRSNRVVHRHTTAPAGGLRRSIGIGQGIISYLLRSFPGDCGRGIKDFPEETLLKKTGSVPSACLDLSGRSNAA